MYSVLFHLDMKTNKKLTNTSLSVTGQVVYIEKIQVTPYLNVLYGLLSLLKVAMPLDLLQSLLKEYFDS